MPTNRKVRSLTALARTIRSLRTHGKRIVFTNGCFDILHVGHVTYLAKARTLGDVLVVGLNSDASVRRLKGPQRPINTARDRAAVLAALEAVDFVTIFPDQTPERVIRALRPDVLVKGGDWKIGEIVGNEFVRACGGTVKSIPFVTGYSTTTTIGRMRRKGSA